MASASRDRHPYVWVGFRLALAFTMLWAFFDKAYGLGRATKAGHAWADGVSPTSGFLGSLHGSLAGSFHGLAGQGWVDWLFMLGLLLIGVALLLGVAVRIACWAGIVLFLLMWAALFPPANNPLFDEHLFYILALLGLQDAKTGLDWSLATWWANLGIVRNNAWLR